MKYCDSLFTPGAFNCIKSIHLSDLFHYYQQICMNDALYYFIAIQPQQSPQKKLRAGMRH